MLSAERQIHWLSLIVKGLSQKGLANYRDQDQVLRAGQAVFSRLLKEHDQIEQKVRQKIASLKRKVTENSSEWHLLYTRYYEEELSLSHFRSTRGDNLRRKPTS